jgi:hypothetical protein
MAARAKKNSANRKISTTLLALSGPKRSGRKNKEAEKETDEKDEVGKGGSSPSEARRRRNDMHACIQRT